MQFTVSSLTLLKQLQAVGGAIGSNATLPILGDFLFQINNSQLSIAATDLETSMVSSIAVNADQNGSVAVPAKILQDMLKNLPEQPLLFRVNEDNFAIEIQTLNGLYKLSGEDGADFPRIPEAAGSEDQLTLPAFVLSAAINKTIFATSKDELRPAMTGVLFAFEDNKINFVATDAHRLVKYTISDLEGDNNSSNSLIIPAKALKLLEKALPSTETPVQLSFERNNAFFSFGEVKLACRLIDARFPDYGAVIPQNNTNHLRINRSELLASLRRIAIFSNRTNYQVVLSLTADQLGIKAQDMDYANEASETMPCEYNGEEMTIGFNAHLLIDLISAMPGDDIKMELSTPGRAALIVPTDDAQSDELLMLIMPIMLHN